MSCLGKVMPIDKRNTEVYASCYEAPSAASTVPWHSCPSHEERHVPWDSGLAPTYFLYRPLPAETMCCVFHVELPVSLLGHAEELLTLKFKSLSPEGTSQDQLNTKSMQACRQCMLCQISNVLRESPCAEQIVKRDGTGMSMSAA